MRDDLDRQLDDLLRQVVELGERADAMLGDACRALRDGDAAGPTAVIAADVEVDRLDAAVQQGVVTTIARRGPVGLDLRRLTALLRASLHLERMGDYAVNVARAAQRSAPFPADEHRLEWATRMILVARQLERYGDHGVDLAEQTIFVVTGEAVELSSDDPR